MLSTILAASVTSALLVGVLAYLMRTWLEARIGASIQHEYQKQFEVFQRELDRREKTQLVADLLAEYIKIPQGEALPREHRHLLNRLSFQASLWLPSDLAIELSKRLQNQPDAKTVFEIVLLARQQLTGDASLQPQHVTHWLYTLESKGDPVLIRPKDR